MVRLELPEPALVVLIGAAGAGKSTLAARWFAPDEILSSDALRARISGDEADQSVTVAAFTLLHRLLATRLDARLTTVVDATNVTAFARRGLVRRAIAAGVPALAIVLDLPSAVVHARNASRSGRTVPALAVDRQLVDLRKTLHRDLAAEGFVAIVHLRTSLDLDSFEVVRAARTGSGGTEPASHDRATRRAQS